RLDPRDLKARTVLAMAERRARRLDAAQARIDEVLREMPIDYLALYARYRILSERNKRDEAERAWADLWRLLSREPDAMLELFFDCAAVEPGAVERIWYQVTYQQRRAVHPILLYATNPSLFSPRDVPAASFKGGSIADPAYVFPHRVEEIEILQA